MTTAVAVKKSSPAGAARRKGRLQFAVRAPGLGARPDAFVFAGTSGRTGARVPRRRAGIVRRGGSPGCGRFPRDAPGAGGYPGDRLLGVAWMAVGLSMRALVRCPRHVHRQEHSDHDHECHVDNLDEHAVSHLLAAGQGHARDAMRGVMPILKALVQIKVPGPGPTRTDLAERNILPSPAIFAAATRLSRRNSNG